MKLNVVETLKGKLSISFLPGSYKAGDLVEVTAEQLEFAETQGLINAGLLLIDKSELPKGKKKAVEGMSEFSNESKGILVFSWGLTVRPAQRFFVPKKHAEGLELLQYIRSGKVLAVNADGEVQKQETPKSEKQEKTEKKSRTIKRVGRDEESESKNGVYVVNPNGEDLVNKANPKGTYVHNPNKGKAPSSIEERIAEIDRENDGGIEFVDQKQAKERLIQTQKSIESRKGV